MDQASQAGPGSLATAADRRPLTQRAHIYGISRRFPSGVDKVPGKRCARRLLDGGWARCPKAARLSA